MCVCVCVCVCASEKIIGKADKPKNRQRIQK